MSFQGASSRLTCLTRVSTRSDRSCTPTSKASPSRRQASSISLVSTPKSTQCVRSVTVAGVSVGFIRRHPCLNGRRNLAGEKTPPPLDELDCLNSLRRFCSERAHHAETEGLEQRVARSLSERDGRPVVTARLSMAAGVKGQPAGKPGGFTRGGPEAPAFCC